MKKIIAIALLTAMLLTCLAGCGMKQGSLAAVAEAEAVGFDATTAGVSTELKNAVTNYTAGTAWDGETIDETWYDAEAEVKTATLADAADLAGFVSLVNKETTFAGWTIELGADINLGGKAWTPVTGSFAGTFDGGNHVISNYTLTGTAAGTGFLGSFTDNATLKNVALINATYVFSGTGSGFVVGTATTTEGNPVTIKNVYVDLTSVTGSAIAVGLVGGASGSGNLLVDACELKGTISLTGNGASTGSVLGKVTAGTVDVTVKNVINNASITLAKKNNAGGIVGHIGVATASLNIDNCVNNGAIECSKHCGGIVGVVEKYPAEIVITNTTNNGTVTGSYCAAIIGRIGTTGTRDYTGIVLKDCANTVDGLTLCGAETPAEVIGYQTTAPVEGAYDLRYVAALHSTGDLYAGFTVTVKYTEDGTTVSTKIAAQDVLAPNAYKSIKGTGAAGEETYAAADFGAEYLYTLVITGIPEAYTVENGKLEVTITPFTSADMESKTASYTVVDGAVVISAGA